VSVRLRSRASQSVSSFLQNEKRTTCRPTIGRLHDVLEQYGSEGLPGDRVLQREHGRDCRAYRGSCRRHGGAGRSSSSPRWRTWSCVLGSNSKTEVLANW